MKVGKNLNKNSLESEIKNQMNNVELKIIKENKGNLKFKFGSIMEE